MHKSVADAWFDSIKSYEGYTNWLYFDTKNLATTGIGNMIDTGKVSLTAFGKSLPWRFKDGSYATESEVAAEYIRLRGLGISKQGGFAYEKHSKIFLDEEVVRWLLNSKTQEFFAVLAKTFPQIETWPADAQLALMNMAWWMGPRFTDSWPNFTASLKRRDFFSAAANCTTKDPSRRNPDNVRRFTTAAKVWTMGLPVTTLYDAKVPDVVDAGLTSISAAQVVAASKAPSTSNKHAWYVQRMLSILGHYTTTVDGLFGSMSVSALKAFCKAEGLSYGINTTVLKALSTKSSQYLPVKK